MRFLALIFSRKIYWLWSHFIKFILVFKGIKIGKNFHIEGIPYLKIRGLYKNIVIGDNVKIFGNIDLRNRENGKIIIGNNIEIDNDCRFVAANNANLKINDFCFLGPYNILNAGDDIFLDSYTISGAFVHIQSSNHGMARGEKIWLQKHTYGKIHISEDVWLGTGCSILAGVSLSVGVIVGAGAVVLKDANDNDVIGGIPAKVISRRK